MNASPNMPADETKTDLSPQQKASPWLRNVFWFAVYLIVFALTLAAILWVMFDKPKYASKKKEYEQVAIEALRMKADNAESVTISEMSEQLDSVYQNRYCQEPELADLSEKYMLHCAEMIKAAPTSLEDYKADEERKCMLDRLSEASESLGLLNDMILKPKGDFCGWRLKVRYKAKDSSGQSFDSETWFIFDKNKKHILTSLDIPIL